MSSRALKRNHPFQLIILRPRRTLSTPHAFLSHASASHCLSSPCSSLCTVLTGTSPPVLSLLVCVPHLPSRNLRASRRLSRSR